MTSVMDNTGYTSLGTGTAKTLLGGASVPIPSWAKGIYSAVPVVAIDVPTAAESVITKFELESQDFQIMPFEILAQVIGAILGATSSGIIPPAPTYQVQCPVKGGDNLNVYAAPLVANTAAPTGSCGIRLGDVAPTMKQRKARMGTLTSSGTTASTDVGGTAYTFTGGNKLIELFGAFVHATVAAASAVMGHIKYVSSEFKPSYQPKLTLNPVGGGLSTLIQTVPELRREPIDLAIAPNSTRIQDYLYMGLAPTVAGNFVSGVVFI